MATALTLLVLGALILAPVALLVALAARHTPQTHAQPAPCQLPIRHHYGGQRIR
jgi:hypothetical protein